MTAYLTFNLDNSIVMCNIQIIIAIPGLGQGLFGFLFSCFPDENRKDQSRYAGKLLTSIKKKLLYFFIPSQYANLMFCKSDFFLPFFRKGKKYPEHPVYPV